MIGILLNIRAVLKKVRGLFRIKLIWWKDLFWNIIKERVYFAKRLECGRALNGKGKRAGGVWAKSPSLLPPLAGKQGGGAPAVAWAGGLRGLSALGKWGKGRASRGGLFPPS